MPYVGISPDLCHFNSRPCGRGDGDKDQVIKCLSHISIHAPAGGATRPLPNMESHHIYFNSRPCGRGDTKSGTLGRSL